MATADSSSPCSLEDASPGEQAFVPDPEWFAELAELAEQEERML